MNVIRLSDNEDVVEIVRSAAGLLRQRKTVEAAALCRIMDHAADEMMDDGVIEVIDTDRIKDKLYVTNGSVIREYGDSCLWTATLALARMIVLANG